ncbi:sulfurtransferase complex subunit TusB [Saccharophagus sp. K07]|jgi:tRNA 2-thiouridine synthesizing protein B|uniref:sulfurtransferase complex subunit TusB n=1 Tax=Saccharophagus sp. K07 TaxID=2283636 RepID=UPI00165294C8|nr:sulfurtransferase complex subunit TusB [Saccharophagus sp. K07]MBC6904863.1 sulfurtransferase complex subunit TusB [Saccharophagus sp. K07]
MLHIISTSPFRSPAIRECLAIAQTGDSLLLLADGVYAVQQGEKVFNGLSVHILGEHAEARGISLPSWATSIDYDGMVALTEQHHPIQTWF